MSRPSRATIRAGVAALALLAATVGGAAYASSRPPASPHLGSPVGRDWFPVPATEGLVTYGSLTSAPATPADVANATVHAEDALRLAAGLGSFGDGQLSPSVTLREVTASTVFDPNAKSLFRAWTGPARPAWVIVWRNAHPVLHGPVTMSAEARAALEASMHCIDVVAVDAADGTALDMEQVCK